MIKLIFSFLFLLPLFFSFSIEATFFILLAKNYDQNVAEVFDGEDPQRTLKEKCKSYEDILLSFDLSHSRSVAVRTYEDSTSSSSVS